ncbi:MAG: hypothetical protein AB7O24_29455 [Kofleriaceae bacterium]
MSDPSAATELPPGRSPAPAERPKYKRKLSNYLLDKKLQLRYVLFVTILSGAIAGALGYLIFQQMRKASESIEQDLQVFAEGSGSTPADNLQLVVSNDLQSGDQQLIFMMVGIGLGLVMILSAYLVLMTHKVAGPLYKVSMYFDRMAVGKLGKVTPLRSGDMLTDFYANFQEMHDAVRSRAVADAELMERVASDLHAAQTQGDYRGDARNKLVEALEALDRHVADRKTKLS